MSPGQTSKVKLDHAPLTTHTLLLCVSVKDHGSTVGNYKQILASRPANNEINHISSTKAPGTCEQEVVSVMPADLVRAGEQV